MIIYSIKIIISINVIVLMFRETTNSQPYNISTILTSTYLVKNIVIFDLLHMAQL